MISSSLAWTIDHYLIARVEGCTTGENAHEVHSLVAIYEGLCLLSATDAFASGRIPEVEARLRLFCHRHQQPSRWGRTPGEDCRVQREIELRAFDVDC